jgi:large subunit ribosomal protein L18
MDKNRSVFRQRLRRKWRVRRDIEGSSSRPRLSVFRSHRNIACQIIDDVSGVTLVSVGTLDSDIAAEVKYGGNIQAAQIIGRKLAEKAVAAGIKEVCFDRGGYKYHGRVAALAAAAREGGLDF